MKPNTKTVRKKTASQPSDANRAPGDMPLPLAKPVATAIAPTVRMSSQTDVPSTYFANMRRPQPISSMTFASMVVAESQMATPRKTDSTGVQPNTLVPTA